MRSYPFEIIYTIKFIKHRVYAMLGIIKRNFNYISINSFILMYKSMVRSLLDYCVPVWVPYKKGDIEVLETVQKKATKIIPEIILVAFL